MTGSILEARAFSLKYITVLGNLDNTPFWMLVSEYKIDLPAARAKKIKVRQRR